MRALTRSSARTGNWPVGIIPTSRETTARSRSSKRRAPTRSSTDARRRQSYDAGARRRRSSAQPAAATGSPTRSPSIFRRSPICSTACAIRSSARAPSRSCRPRSCSRPHEAFEGTTVPLGIPVRQTCLRCGGRGETWQEWCGLCGGCGDVPAFHDVELRVPAGVREGERFRFS